MERILVKVKITYKAGHSYNYVYELTDLFCPCCSKKTIWSEISAGDYYEGPTHVCRSCESCFTLPRLEKADYTHQQVLTQINKTVKDIANGKD